MKGMIGFILMCVVCSSFILNWNTPEKDWNGCAEKYNTLWDESCKQCMYSKGTYQVWIRNTCKESVDMQVCAQEKDKRWKCFKTEKMAPRDTMIAYACIGNGKYLWWVRKAGDKSTEFPTVEQVNARYQK